ncbi:cobalamin-dependent protein [Leptolyngbya sp. 15MV]|nr:cobalamin-dependent protein [Leptolyngbya sp. 15MV]
MAPVTDPRTPGRSSAAASVEGNTHDLGVRFVADFFELEGWRAIYLGPSVPVADLVQGAHDFGADLVALSATLATQLRAAEDTIALLRASDISPSVRVIVGGQGFAAAPGAWQAMGADGFASDAREAVTLGDRLVPVPNTRQARGH